MCFFFLSKAAQPSIVKTNLWTRLLISSGEGNTLGQIASETLAIWSMNSVRVHPRIFFSFVDFFTVFEKFGLIKPKIACFIFWWNLFVIRMVRTGFLWGAMKCEHFLTALIWLDEREIKQFVVPFNCFLKGKRTWLICLIYLAVLNVLYAIPCNLLSGSLSLSLSLSLVIKHALF